MEIIFQRHSPFSSLSQLSLLSLSLPKTLDQKFDWKDIKFSDSGDVELTVRNGSLLRLQVANNHITFTRPKVSWKDDGFDEVLYTVGSGGGGRAKGRIGLVMYDNDVSGPTSKALPLITSEWSMKDVDFDSIDALQVFD